MREVADGVVQLRSSPLSPNVHVAGDVVVDAGTRLGARRILGQLRGRAPRALVLTHVHPPPQGAAHALCTRLELELWCGRGEVATAESGQTARAQPDHWFNPVQQRLFAGPGHPVARALGEGDEVAGFTVLEVPGHAPGHIALWRESDRTLLLGDVLNHQNVWTGRTGLHEPPALFTPDPARNRESARRLAALRPRTALFSHGPPLRDPDALERFVETLA
jgi:glyoxylase-like metal-dependent hydrolase (beta-lactamase superfamily II)